MRRKLKIKTRGSQSSLLTAMLWGAASAVLAEVILLAAAAGLMVSGVMGEGAMRAVCVGCAFLSAFLGALTAAAKTPKLILPTALGVGAALMGINLVVGVLLPEGDGFSPIIAAAFIVGAALAGVLAAMKKVGK